jgi:dTDP-L-rhamnose 4-epimerase
VNVLITGGAGFIGSHTADTLIAEGHSVRVLDVLDPQIHGDKGAAPDYLNSAVEFRRGDVRTPEDVTAALEGIDAVFHLAALTGVGQSMYDMRSYVDVSCTGTATLLEAIVKREKPVRRFVLASSRAVYGEGTYTCELHGQIRPGLRRRERLEAGDFLVYCPQCGRRAEPAVTGEDSPAQPLSLYGWTKLAQEDLCRHAAKTYGLPVVILRYFNVYGSRQSLRNPYTGVVSVFYSRLVNRNPIQLYERGLPVRDFVHVRDVARANVLALHAPVPVGTAINVGSSRQVTVEGVAQALAAGCSVEGKFEQTDIFRVGDIFGCIADLGRARTLLSYEPEIDLAQGMTEFVAWARGQEAVDLYSRSVEELGRFGLLGRGR